MRPDILTGDVGNELLVAVLIVIEDERPFLPLIFGSIPLAAKEESEFEGHVEARQSGHGIQRHSRKVVYAVAALFDHSFDLVYSKIPSILFLEGAACDKAQVIHREANRVEQRLITEM